MHLQEFKNHNAKCVHFTEHSVYVSCRVCVNFLTNFHKNANLTSSFVIILVKFNQGMQLNFRQDLLGHIFEKEE